MRIDFGTHHLDQMMEDYEFMKRNGESDDRAAARLGITTEELATMVASMERRVQRAAKGAP